MTEDEVVQLMRGIRSMYQNFQIPEELDIAESMWAATFTEAGVSFKEAMEAVVALSIESNLDWPPTVSNICWRANRLNREVAEIQRQRRMSGAPMWRDEEIAYWKNQQIQQRNVALEAGQ